MDELFPNDAQIEGLAMSRALALIAVVAEPAGAQARMERIAAETAKYNTATLTVPARDSIWTMRVGAKKIERLEEHARFWKEIHHLLTRVIAIEDKEVAA
jgi:hypothetical protein